MRQCKISLSKIMPDFLYKNTLQVPQITAMPDSIKAVKYRASAGLQGKRAHFSKLECLLSRVISRPSRLLLRTRRAM